MAIVQRPYGPHPSQCLLSIQVSKRVSGGGAGAGAGDLYLPSYMAAAAGFYKHDHKPVLLRKAMRRPSAIVRQPFPLLPRRPQRDVDKGNEHSPGGRNGAGGGGVAIPNGAVTFVLIFVHTARGRRKAGRGL